MAIHIADADARPGTTAENEGTEEVIEEVTESVIPAEDPGEIGEDPAEGGDDAETPESDEEVDEASAFVAEVEAWSQEFATKGELSEETIEAINEKIFAPHVPADVRQQILESYLHGFTAMQQTTAQEVFALVGGEEPYQKMLEWGNKNLTPEEATAFDEAALGPDRVKRDAAIKGLYARMQQDTGSRSDFEPDLSHNAGRAGGDPIIASRQELVRIMRSPEYDKDPAVREKVARQLRQSMATGKYVSD